MKFLPKAVFSIPLYVVVSGKLGAVEACTSVPGKGDKVISQ